MLGQAEMFFFIVIKQQMGESAINVVLCDSRQVDLKPNPTLLACKLQAALSCIKLIFRIVQQILSQIGD